MNLGLTGYPLKKSLSPAIFSFLFEKAGISGSYSLFRIQERNFSLIFKELKKTDGFNVTSPFKELTAGLCDNLTREAGIIASVNAVVLKNGTASGHNTDITGLRASLSASGFPLKNASACIFGSGGAARAATYALCMEKTAKVFLVSRNPGLAKTKIAGLRKKFEDTFFSVLKTGAEPPAEISVFINASTAENKTFIFPEKTGPALFLDLNYGGGSRFLEMAPATPASFYMDGREMLFYQALESFRLWTGKNTGDPKRLKTEFFSSLKETL